MDLCGPPVHFLSTEVKNLLPKFNVAKLSGCVYLSVFILVLNEKERAVAHTLETLPGSGQAGPWRWKKDIGMLLVQWVCRSLR